MSTNILKSKKKHFYPDEGRWNGSQCLDLIQHAILQCWKWGKFWINGKNWLGPIELKQYGREWWQRPSVKNKCSSSELTNWTLGCWLGTKNNNNGYVKGKSIYSCNTETTSHAVDSIQRLWTVLQWLGYCLSVKWFRDVWWD